MNDIGASQGKTAKSPDNAVVIKFGIYKRDLRVCCGKRDYNLRKPVKYILNVFSVNRESSYDDLNVTVSRGKEIVIIINHRKH